MKSKDFIKYKVDQTSQSGLIPEELSPFQERLIQSLIRGQDLLSNASFNKEVITAVLLSIVVKIGEAKKYPQILIITPTKALSEQILTEFREIVDKGYDIKAAGAYGSASIKEQKRMLKKGAQIIVGTPGRIVELVNSENLDLGHIKEVVLCEADEMFKVGYREDIKWILNLIDSKVQISLFYKTYLEALKVFSHEYLKSPVNIDYNKKDSSKTLDSLEHKYFLIEDKELKEGLLHLLQINKGKNIQIFCRTDEEAFKLSEELFELGFLSEDNTLESSLYIQADGREMVKKPEKIDIIINYDLPENEDGYENRIQEVNFRDDSGLVLTLVRKQDKSRFSRLKEHLKRDFQHISIFSKKSTKNSLEYFKQHILSSSEKPADEYLNLVEELKQEGLKPEYVAAVLLSKEYPLDNDSIVDRLTQGKLIGKPGFYSRKKVRID